MFFQEADLNCRYPDGVYINLHGSPDFSPDAVREVDLTGIQTGDRHLDILMANMAMREIDDPLWRGLATGEIPDGFTPLLAEAAKVRPARRADSVNGLAEL